MNNTAEMLRETDMPELAKLYEACKLSQGKLNDMTIEGITVNPDGFIDIWKSLGEIEVAMSTLDIIPRIRQGVGFGGINRKTRSHVSALEYIESLSLILPKLSETAKADLEKLASINTSLSSLLSEAVELHSTRPVDLST